MIAASIFRNTLICESSELAESVTALNGYDDCNGDSGSCAGDSWQTLVVSERPADRFLSACGIVV